MPEEAGVRRDVYSCCWGRYSSPSTRVSPGRSPKPAAPAVFPSQLMASSLLLKVILESSLSFILHIHCDSASCCLHLHSIQTRTACYHRHGLCHHLSHGYLQQPPTTLPCYIKRLHLGPCTAYSQHSSQTDPDETQVRVCPASVQTLHCISILGPKPKSLQWLTKAPA